MRLIIVLGLCLVGACCAHAATLEAYAHDQSGALPPHKLPFVGNGTCGEPHFEADTGVTSVSCLGPAHLLKPGETINVMFTAETPFPVNESVVVLNETSQIVDSTLRPVPLSEVYVHHFGAGTEFKLGSGAELRGSFTRKPLPAPYVDIVNGTACADPKSRLANIQLINTVGLPEGHAKPCLECWCDHDPYHPSAAVPSNLTGHPHSSADHGDPTGQHARPASLKGSLLCCHQCPSTTPDAPPVAYHLQYNISYRSLKPDEAKHRVDAIFFDVTGFGNFEYNIAEATGPNTSHLLVQDTTVDKLCPQKSSFDIIRCTAHQHFGGQCMDLINLEKNETICTSCPVFGTEKDVPGNEEGYVVAIPDDNLAKPYTIAPGTPVRVQSKYDASVPRFGVMGLFVIESAGMPGPCRFPPGNVSATLPEFDLHTPRYRFGIPLVQSQPSVVVS